MTYIAHHGILGMKWGIRRYQNKDGSLTEEGKKRYGIGEEYDPNRPTPEEDLARHNRNVRTAKRVATITGAAAIGTLIVSPKAREAVGGALKKMGGQKIVKDADGKVIQEATGLRKVLGGMKEGAKEGATNAPKTFAKMVSFGLVTLGMKEVTDIIAGKALGNNEAGKKFVNNLYVTNDKDKLAKPSSWQMDYNDLAKYTKEHYKD